MLLPGREWQEGYRFGYNGKECDLEVFNQSKFNDYGFRIYNTTLGRFLSVDPISYSFAMLTPYQYASNSPVALIDLDGLEGTAPAPPPSNNAITNIGEPNRVLLPNTPHVEYTYYVDEDKYGNKIYMRRSNIYNLPVNRASARSWRQRENYVQQISKHEFENGRNWVIIGSANGTPPSPPTTSKLEINGVDDSDLGVNRSVTVPGGSGIVITGNFDPLGGGAFFGVSNQLTITDATTGTIIFSTGFVNTSVPIMVTTAASSVIISISPLASEMDPTPGTIFEDNFTVDLTTTEIPAAAGGGSTLVDSDDHSERVFEPEYTNKRVE